MFVFDSNGRTGSDSQPYVTETIKGGLGEVYTYYGERQILFCLFRHSLPVLCKRVEEGRDVVFATVERASSLLCVVVY